MTPRNRKIIVFALIGIFALWLLGTLPGILNKTKTHTTPQEKAASQNYEPKFRKDGELWVVKSETQDTIATFEIEIAQSEEAIQYGMMYRKSMDTNKGMLFLMKMERPQSFWMKNTYISLDIVYINSNNSIVSIQENATPLSEKSLPSYEPAIYVLELNGGVSAQMGIQAGDKVFFKQTDNQ